MKKLLLASVLSLIVPMAMATEITDKDFELVTRCAKAADLAYFTMTNYSDPLDQGKWVNVNLGIYEKKNTLGNEDPSRENVENAWRAMAVLVEKGLPLRNNLRTTQWLTSYATGTCIVGEQRQTSIPSESKGILALAK